MIEVFRDGSSRDGADEHMDAVEDFRSRVGKVREMITGLDCNDLTQVRLTATTIREFVMSVDVARIPQEEVGFVTHTVNGLPQLLVDKLAVKSPVE